HRLRPFALYVRAPDRVEPGAPLVAEWTFFGPLPRATLIVEALVRAARAGLGPDRIPHTVRRMVVRGDGAPATVLADGEVVGRWPAPVTLAHAARLPDHATGARVHLVSRTQLDARRPTQLP